MLKSCTKRGQVTVFIILGIVILMLTASVLMMVKFITQEQIDIEEQEFLTSLSYESVEIFVQSCLDITAENAIELISVQGGYHKVSENYVNNIFFKIPYYFDVGENSFPNLNEINQSLVNYMLEELPYCLNDFSYFTDVGYEIETGEMLVEVEMNDQIIFNFDYPITIKQISIEKEVKSFVSEIDLNFLEVYNIINDTFNEHSLNPNHVPIGYLTASSEYNNFTFDLYYNENDVVIYSLTFDQYQINDEDYTFIFASRYNWSNLQEKSSVEYLQPVEDQYCYVGDRCYYNMNIYNDPYIFEDYTSLFDISSDGKVEFTAQEENLGNHSLVIKISHEDDDEYVSFRWSVYSLGGESE